MLKGQEHKTVLASAYQVFLSIAIALRFINISFCIFVWYNIGKWLLFKKKIVDNGVLNKTQTRGDTANDYR